MKALNILMAGAAVLMLASCANTGQMDLKGPKLAGGEWVAVGDNTASITDAIKSTAVFDGKGGLSGNAGCHTYTATTDFGPMFGYMSAKDFEIEEAPCADEKATAQEARFVEILAAAKYYRFNEQGDLIVTSEDGSELHFIRAAG